MSTIGEDLIQSLKESARPRERRRSGDCSRISHTAGGARTGTPHPGGNGPAYGNESFGLPKMGTGREEGKRSGDQFAAGDRQ